MSVFEGIEHVSAEGTTNLRQYFEPGVYTVTIDRVFLHEKRLGGGKLFIVETTVNESDNPNIKPGEQRNWVQSFALPSALPRIKAFIGAALGYCSSRDKNKFNETVTASFCNSVLEPENRLKGCRVTLKGVNKKTRAGNNFTQINWG